ncbi:hypothetical protein ERJ75_001770600 [Trypanosoma vivax]|nr:hypothetical protein ERJ75_001770600 [Trypanosoma vivax]
MAWGCRKDTCYFYCECEAGEKQRRAVHKYAVIGDGIREDTGSDVLVVPSEGSSVKSHKACAANDAVGHGPRLRRDGVQEGLGCCPTRVCHGALLVRNCAAADGKLYQASERPQRSRCRLEQFTKSTQDRPAQSSALRGDRGRHHDERSYCESGGWGVARNAWHARGGKKSHSLTAWRHTQ